MVSPALAAPVAAHPALGAVVCAISLASSARPVAPPTTALQMKLPSFKLPDWDIDLPGGLKLPGLSGKKKTTTKSASPNVSSAPPPPGSVKVRASAAVQGSRDAPSLGELRGDVDVSGIAAGNGWKRFPNRRMPGANMEGWKDVAKDLTSKM